MNIVIGDSVTFIGNNQVVNGVVVYLTESMAYVAVVGYPDTFKLTRAQLIKQAENNLQDDSHLS